MVQFVRLNLCIFTPVYVYFSLACTYNYIHSGAFFSVGCTKNRSFWAPIPENRHIQISGHRNPRTGSFRGPTARYIRVQFSSVHACKKHIKNMIRHLCHGHAWEGPSISRHHKQAKFLKKTKRL